MEEDATLIKFGQLAHLKQLQSQGLLYMNNLPYIWKIEDDGIRGDPYDSIDEIARGRKGTLKAKNDSKISIVNWNLRIGPPEPEKINIFCMYALRPQKGTFPVSPMNYKFGNHALVFTKPQVFIDRVSVYVKEKVIKSKADLVDYVDDSFKGEMGPFKKFQKFSYQSEWRLVCFNGPGRERKLFVGNLQDISILMLSTEVNNKIIIDSNGTLQLNDSN